MQREKGWKTSSSIVTTRADGSRPALHMSGATGNFFVTDAMLPKVIAAKVVHAGGVGLMAHDGQRTDCRIAERGQARRCAHDRGRLCRVARGYARP